MGDIRGPVNKRVNDEVKGRVYPDCMTVLNAASTRDKGSYGRLAKVEEQHRDRPFGPWIHNLVVLIRGHGWW